MDVILSAIKALENSFPSSDSKNRDAKVAVTQLRSTVDLLKQRTLSSSDAKKLSNLLRQPLISLYGGSLLPALDYTTAVFRFVHQSRILPSLKSKESIHPWEKVLVSMLSGLLDFLEDIESENKPLNSKCGKNLASTMFPLLCPLFFGLLSRHVIEFDGHLSSVVYQVLMTIVTIHPPNATKLREDIGGKRLGITISRTKEFLVMESLLELFAILIPSVQGGREKRRNFITAVFNPAIFRCSDKVIQCLESLTNPDWTVTSAAIVEALADSDTSFPQPFEIHNLAVDNQLLHQASSFHVDKSQFIANLEKDGKIETFHLPFSTVRRITSSPSNNADAFVQIFMRTSEPAILGDRPIKIKSVGEMTISLDLKESLFKNFEQALQSRSLHMTTVVTRKQSKAKEIELDFNIDNSKSGPTLTQEKVRSLSRLWANDPPLEAKAGNPYASSPLNQESESSTTVDPALILADTASNITEQAPDDEGVGRTKYNLSRKNKIICSDDEGSLIVNSHQQPVSKPRAAEVADVEDCPDSCSSEAYNSMRNGTEPSQESPSVIRTNDRKQGHNNAAKRLKKRPASAIEDTGENVIEEECQATKRLRRDAVDVPPVPSTRPGRVKKYTTTKNHLPMPKVDFDEVPVPEVTRPVVKPSNLRSSGMRNKNGKSAPKTRRAIEKESKVGTEERSDPDVTLIGTVDKKVQSIRGLSRGPGQDRESKQVAKSPAGETEDSKGHQQSARALTAHALPSKEGGQRKQTTKKSQKAPWEDKELFASKAESLAVAFDGNEGLLTSEALTNEIVQEAHGKEELLRGNDIFYSVKHTDVAVPLKSTSSSPKLEQSKLESNVITIDLTDESPVALRINRQAIAPGGKSKAQSDPKEELDQLAEDGGVYQEKSVKSSSRMKPMEEIPSPLGTDAMNKLLQLPAAQESLRAIKVDVPTFSPAAEKDIGPQEEHTSGWRKEWQYNEASPAKRRGSFHNTSDALLSPLLGMKTKNRHSANFDLRQVDRTSEGAGKPSTEEGTLPRLARSRNIGTQEKQPQERLQRNFKTASGFAHEEPLDKIVKALSEINQVVIDKVCRRFDGVTEELHAGQRAILEATAGIAKDMCNTSARHFNDMIDLEADYNNQQEKITRGLQNYLKTTEQLSLCFKDVVNQHNQRSLSRKFPPKLVDKIPTIFRNPKLEL